VLGIKGSRRAILWSPEAEQDLLGVWHYIAHASGPVECRRSSVQIDATCFGLGGWLEYGKAREDIRASRARSDWRVASHGDASSVRARRAGRELGQMVGAKMAMVAVCRGAVVGSITRTATHP
jgi:plasmid stabilization system protein ParE